MKFKYVFFLIVLIFILFVIILKFSSLLKITEYFENEKNIYFITFSAGSQNFYDAGNRLINQANNLNLFNNIQKYGIVL